MLLELKNVSIGYGKKSVIEGLNLVVSQSDFIGIVGPNGSGKTTILKTILGIIKPLKGSFVKKNGISLKLSYVPQIQTIDEIFPLSVSEIVMLSRMSNRSALQSVRDSDRESVISALKETGIESHARHLYRDLSGGLRQRVLIARALAGNPDLLVLDEPTNDLDVASSYNVMELIKKLHQKHGIAIVLVSHYLQTVINYADTIGFIKDNKLVVVDNNNQLDSKELSDIYGVKIRTSECYGRQFTIVGENT